MLSIALLFRGSYPIQTLKEKNDSCVGDPLKSACGYPEAPPASPPDPPAPAPFSEHAKSIVFRKPSIAFWRKLVIFTPSGHFSAEIFIFSLPMTPWIRRQWIV